MIITNKVHNIIMLCDAEEERVNPVCVNYWVNDGERIIEDITLEFID